MNQAYQSSVLVVDDTPANLEILTQMLKDRGHRPRPVPSGALALRAAEHEPPDLVLMDINMPEMDGFETCQRLKARDELTSVPILFISARSDTYDKIQAFRSGGVDYITKPFDLDEVTARVETHLELARLQRELHQQYDQLSELERLRDNLVHMVVHDMRSPLSVIKVVLSVLKDETADLIDNETLLDLEAACNCSDKLMVMVNNLLDLSRLESGNMPLYRNSVPVRELVDSSMAIVKSIAVDHVVTIDHGAADTPVDVDHSLLQRVLVNLVTNAIKFTPDGGKITVATRQVDDQVEISVTDTGPGIDPQYHQRIFEKFGQVGSPSEKQPSTGLGLTFCQLAVEAHLGTIGVESAPGEGARFYLRLAKA